MVRPGEHYLLLVTRHDESAGWLYPRVAWLLLSKLSHDCVVLVKAHQMISDSKQSACFAQAWHEWQIQ